MSQIEANKALSQAVAQMGKITYPINLAPRGQVIDDFKAKDGKKMYHIPDPYRWLEETNSKATTAWVDAEIAITDKFLA